MEPWLTPDSPGRRSTTSGWPTGGSSVGTIEANFRFGSYAAAGAFAGRAAAIADDHNHHPTIHLTYPGVVHVVSTSHDVHGVSQRDIRLAEAISTAAAEAGGAGQLPTGSASTEIAIDALDIDAVRPFWKAVLGYVEAKPGVEGDIVRQVEDPNGIGPSVWFQQMDSPRPQRNRIHFDVVVPHDVADAGGRDTGCRGTPGQRRPSPRVLGTGRPRGQRGLHLHLAGPRLTRLLPRPPARLNFPAGGGKPRLRKGRVPLRT